jgi:hypothetical protein
MTVGLCKDTQCSLYRDTMFFNHKTCMRHRPKDAAFLQKVYVKGPVLPDLICFKVTPLDRPRFGHSLCKIKFQALSLIVN